MTRISILIPSIGEPSAASLFIQIGEIISRPYLHKHYEVILLVSGKSYSTHTLGTNISWNCRLLHHPVRMGASCARNRLVQEATGTHIIFCDADSYVCSPSTLAHHLSDLHTLVSRLTLHQIIVFSEQISLRKSLLTARLTEWNFCLPRSLFLRCGGFPSNIGVGSSSIVQSGEAQFLQNRLYKLRIIPVYYPFVFCHPLLGDIDEAIQLVNEKKYFHYSLGSGYTTIVNLILSPSLLSLYHFIVNIGSTTTTHAFRIFQGSGLWQGFFGRCIGYFYGLLNSFWLRSIKRIYPESIE